MKTNELKVKITFLENILGTQTGDKDIYRSFIGSKAPDAKSVEEEVEAVKVKLGFQKKMASHSYMTIGLGVSLKVLVVL